MMAAILELSGITKRYSGFCLGPVDLRLEEGLFLGLVGPNGSGKTTLIRMLLGMTMPDSGTISLFGLDPWRREIEVKRQIGFALQDHRLWGALSPSDLASVLKDFYPSWDRKTWLRLVDRLEIPLKKSANKLSAGLRMRLALATALAHHARLLVLDEPSAGLDPLVRQEFIALIREYMEEEGASVIFASHICSDLQHSADQVLFLLDGQVAHAGDLAPWVDSHVLVRLPPGHPDCLRLIGCQTNDLVCSGLSNDPGYWTGRAGLVVDPANLEDVLVARMRQHRLDSRVKPGEPAMQAEGRQ